MPKEIKSSDQFQKLMSKASEIRVVRNEDTVKLKLRTPELLYTYKTSSSEADDILKAAKDLEVVELTRVSEKKKTADEETPKKAEDNTTEGEKTAQKPRPAKKRK
jgi:hypothetical protein